jgi:huntingtin interacting protein 1
MLTPFLSSFSCLFRDIFWPFFPTTEFFFLQCDLLFEVLNKDVMKSTAYLREKGMASPKDSLSRSDSLIQALIQYYHQLSLVYSCGKSIEQSLANIELGYQLMSCLRDVVSNSLELNSVIKTVNNLSCPSSEQEAKMLASLNSLIDLKKKIVPEMTADVSKDIGEQLKQELHDMESSIREAAKRIEELAANSKKTDTGIKLEVNEKILDSCTGLMAAIMQLISDSKGLQEEIISQAKHGSSNGVSAAAVKEFYQRNHRWTEGLISAAKVVALAAKMLVDSSDKVVSGKAKFSEMMVAANEIAAATAQLVVASRVKADRTSVKLSALSSSSKRVSECTGNIVATSKICAEKLDTNVSKLDFTKMTLTQAKKLEFESQAKVIELSSELDKERQKLASLRKQHYHLTDQ